MSEMKLNYFDAKGRAELARLILAYSGAAHDDHRINFADWPSLKSGAKTATTTTKFLILSILSKNAHFYF
jgi:hypothetical protein